VLDDAKNGTQSESPRIVLTDAGAASALVRVPGLFGAPIIFEIPRETAGFMARFWSRFSMGPIEQRARIWRA
jgi:hypothetical protein